MLSKIINKIRVAKILKYTWVTGAIISIAGSGIVSLYHIAYVNKVYPYVAVAKTNVSNLKLDEVKQRLSQQIPTEMPIMMMKFSSQEFELNLNKMEVKYKPEETAENIYLLGRSDGWKDNLKVKWRLWTKNEHALMKFDFDKEELTKTIELIKSQIEEPVIEPGLELINTTGQSNQSQINILMGKNGRVVDEKKLEEKIMTRVGSLDFEPIDIPVKLALVNVSEEELLAAQTRAEKIKEKALNIKYKTIIKNVEGQELIELIDLKDGWSDEKIASLAANLANQVNRPAQDASFRFKDGRVVEFKPDLPGLTVDEIETKRLIKTGLDSLETEQEKAEVELSVQIYSPRIKTSEVNDLGIKELLGKGESTFYHSIPSRKHNVALTAGKLNGVLIPPGEVFSFNQTVGDISAATGYQSAYIIKDGRTVLGDGGGVCQDSTTMFRAALNAGLEIIERHPHAYRVTYYEQNSPPGIDATVYAPSPDLKFKNDTPAHVLIQTYVDVGNSYLKIEIYGTSDGRSSTISNARIWDQVPPPPDEYQDDPGLPAGTIKQVDWAAWGAKTAFDWKVVRNGETLHQRTFYSNYRPWRAVYLRGIGG